MNVLVTGGSGYLGAHVRRFFNADDFSRRAGFDICDEADAVRAGDYDVIIHLAAHLDKSPEAAEECFRVNAEGTAKMLRQMRAGSVFIYASTKDVYGANAERFREVAEDCPTDYMGQSALEWSKLVGEKYVEYYARQMDVRACIFRLSTVYAPPSDDNEPNFVGYYVEAIKRGTPIQLPSDGEPVRDILHVDDFSRACRAFVDSSHAFGLYNLGGGKENALTLRQLADKIADVLYAAPIFAAADETAPPPLPFHYITDLTRVKEELDWRPQINLEEGLRSLL